MRIVDRLEASQSCHGRGMQTVAATAETALSSCCPRKDRPPWRSGAVKHCGWDKSRLYAMADLGIDETLQEVIDLSKPGSSRGGNANNGVLIFGL